MFASIPFPNIENYVFQIPGFHLGDHFWGPFPLRWYALAYIAGLVIGWRYMVRMVQDGAVVTRDVAPGAIVAGNPAVAVGSSLCKNERVREDP